MLSLHYERRCARVVKIYVPQRAFQGLGAGAIIPTSLSQFSRSVGAAVGVAGMGALMTRQPTGVSIPGGAEAIAASGVMLTGVARLQFAAALHSVFLVCAALAAASFAVALFLPPVDFSPGLAPAPAAGE